MGLKNAFQVVCFYLHMQKTSPKKDNGLIRDETSWGESVSGRSLLLHYSWSDRLFCLISQRYGELGFYNGLILNIFTLFDILWYH